MSMNEDEFDLQLKSRFAQADKAIAEIAVDRGFSDSVSGHISRQRRMRILAKSLGAALLAMAAYLLAQPLQSVAGVAADFSVQLTGEIGQLASTPAAFACGVLIAVAAVVFATLSDG